MKLFFKTYGYDALKMFLNQFATAIFGVSLALAASSAQNPVLRNVTSIGAILFYLFLLYTMTWDIGFRDKVSVESGKRKKDSYLGAKISLLANLPNFIFAILIALATLFNSSALSAMGAFGSGGALILEGMYTGLLANHVGGAALNSQFWVYFLLPIPAIVICGVAYRMGQMDIKIFKSRASGKGRD